MGTCLQLERAPDRGGRRPVGLRHSVWRGGLLVGCMFTVVGCFDGSNIGTVEEATGLLTAIVELQAELNAPTYSSGEWTEECPDGGLFTFRRDVESLEPKDAAEGTAREFGAAVTLTLDSCGVDGMLLMGVVVVELARDSGKDWADYWGEVAIGTSQETLCHFDAEHNLGEGYSGTICGFPASEFELEELR